MNGRRNRNRAGFCIIAGVCSWFGLPLTAYSEPNDFGPITLMVEHSVVAVVCSTAGPQSATRIHGTAFFINAEGRFLTAAHVVNGLHNGDPRCGSPAVYWPGAEGEADQPEFYTFKFALNECRVDAQMDLAVCKTIENVAQHPKLATKPLGLPIDGRIEPNGTPVAFTGFTLDSLAPLTARSQLVGYQALNLLLDKAPWPGASGAPAYNIEGRVIGLLVQRMSDIAIARSGPAIKEFLDQR